MEPQVTNGKAVAALVLGILSIVIPYMGLILGIIGLVLAHGALKEIVVSGQEGRGLAIAGRVTSIVGVCIWGVFFLFLILSLLLAISFSYSV
ncbi:DUF4190 domain-containing protein [Ornithinibacillus halotolerans]|uniref:DUF4190 domain-containing protein n=1 Tax=Ornithinibacillus halotolerans TaxID=1274357 RepID=A0A916S5Q9_9BACI|nr:DUF4190 domain-containing protein [Ornithinibacillus halotolerans]GGA85528.1 hypothetical protein GCM10008025_30670 [Ornithinibacillus halotolerans]